MKLKKLLEFIKRLLGFTDETVLYYITGNDALPVPLSQEEETEALKKLSEGDATVKSVLIERNLRLVVYIARKFDNTGVDIEDLISVGTIGLIKAVNSFAPEKNIKLATYASRCIENEILMYLRRIIRIKSEVSLDEPLNVDFEGNELLMSDILGTEPDLVSKNIENTVEKQLLWDAINKLSAREKAIMEMRFGLEGREEKHRRRLPTLWEYLSRIFQDLKKR